MSEPSEVKPPALDDVHKQELSELEYAEGADAVITFTRAEERRFLMKLDPILITFAMLLYVCAYIDRGNMGNARLMGLQADALQGSDTNYSIALSLFYVTYIICAIPGTLMSKYLLPSTALGMGCALWAIAGTCMASASSPAGVYVCRLFLGIGEATFGQAVALTCSYWYTKKELATRIGIFISAGSLAGATGGLIAFAVASIQNPIIQQWRILFLIEGLPGLLLAALVFFFLPTHPENWRYLTPRERQIAVARKSADSTNEGHTGVDWNGVKRAFSDWKIYLMAVMYTCMNCNLSSIGGFLPTIVKGLGYTSAEAQLFTVPPYAVALCVTILVSFISDKARSRGIPIACTYGIGIVGWAILYAVDASTTDHARLQLRYFGVICVVAPAYATIPLQMSWASAQNPSQSQRAIALGMLNTIGQIGSVVGANIFPSNEGPQYVKGVSVNIAFQCLGALLAICMSLYLRRENRERNQREGKYDLDASGLQVQTEYDRAKGFRYMV